MKTSKPREAMSVTGIMPHPRTTRPASVPRRSVISTTFIFLASLCRSISQKFDLGKQIEVRPGYSRCEFRVFIESDKRTQRFKIPIRLLADIHTAVGVEFNTKEFFQNFNQPNVTETGHIDYYYSPVIMADTGEVDIRFNLIGYKSVSGHLVRKETTSAVREKRKPRNFAYSLGRKFLTGPARIDEEFKIAESIGFEISISPKDRYDAVLEKKIRGLGDNIDSVMRAHGFPEPKKEV